MKLTENFSLSELTKTNHKVFNYPNPKEIENLKLLCENVLQPIRDNFGRVFINSGYRSPILNRVINGAINSQHMKGEAADIEVKNPKEVFEWIRENLDFDQLINEYDFSWIHVSYKKQGNRKQVLKANRGINKTIYTYE